MTTLVPYEEYSREEVHDIFSPDTIFTPQAGTWGLQGVVPIPDRPGDWVFFVTFGQTQGEHTFDEGITEEGVLTWQSQPQQSLNDARVQQWINHDDLAHTIYLFLRTSRDRRYAYLGRLKYLEHDRERQRPVYFQWQIIDWSLSLEKQKLLNLQLQQIASTIPNFPKPLQSADFSGELTEVPPPAQSKHSGQNTPQFKGKKNADYSVKDALDKKLGNAGELAILDQERKYLIGVGRSDLADKISHISEIEGDGAGYDIRSFGSDGKVKYIEVKTTKGGISTPFFMSINEIRFSATHSERYVLYRLFEFKVETKSGKMYKIEGNVESKCQLEPINFRARI